MSELAGERRVCVLVALELNLDREATSQAMALLRPEWNVQQVEPDTLDRQITASQPTAVLCAVLTDTIVEQVPIWFLSDPPGTSRYVVSLGGSRTDFDNLGFYRILELIDEASNHVFSRG